MKNSEHFTEWNSQVEEWRAKYDPHGINTNGSSNTAFNPTGVVVIKKCRKCNKVKRRMSRHHKGHEFLFACLLPDSYAARYIQFHPDDVDWLCNRCHTRAHVVISHIVTEIYEYVNTCTIRNRSLTVRELEEFRKRILDCYSVWINFRKPKRKRRVKK